MPAAGADAPQLDTPGGGANSEADAELAELMRAMVAAQAAAPQPAQARQPGKWSLSQLPARQRRRSNSAAGETGGASARPGSRLGASGAAALGRRGRCANHHLCCSDQGSQPCSAQRQAGSARVRCGVPHHPRAHVRTSGGGGSAHIRAPRSKVRFAVAHNEGPGARGLMPSAPPPAGWIAREQALGRAPTSPMTGQPLQHLQLSPNHALRGILATAAEAGLLR